MGLCLRKGAAYNLIEGNEIFDLGAGGIGAGYAGFAKLGARWYWLDQGNLIHKITVQYQEPAA
jgi:hypothetical protein